MEERQGGPPCAAACDLVMMIPPDPQPTISARKDHMRFANAALVRTAVLIKKRAMNVLYLNKQPVAGSKDPKSGVNQTGSVQKVIALTRQGVSTITTL